jgi:hypothetical protein
MVHTLVNRLAEQIAVNLQESTVLRQMSKSGNNKTGTYQLHENFVFAQI